ncbi:hypothetical protein LCGC14_1232330 [marine sediment metagenome]|uniref:Uncharacterized protein n=1 Tax=marine sediment metagenome TaxID=412755 RepID=A0A0F9NQF6_9ZZZZ
MCPDFPTPPGGGATAAQVWSYAGRALDSDTANAIRDAILNDATLIAGADVGTIKSKTDNLPIDPADQSLVIAATDALSGEIATRSPSGEYNTQLDANISTRAAIADYSAARAAKIDAIQAFIEEAFGSLLMDATEQTVKEILTTINKLHCFVDLTPMLASDVVIVRQYMQILTAGSFIKYAEETFNDVQTLPLLYIVTKPARYGIRITLQQTAGTNRTLDWETFQEKAA